MRSLRLTVLALASLALLSGGRAQAQRLPTNAAWSARSAIPASAQTERSAFVEPVPVRSAGMSSAQGATRRLLHLVGGAVVGSWVGYVTSQVMRSDWEKDSNSEFAEYRQTSAGIG
ncbi:MAG: hypothetical protein M3483_03355, partial [Gemmatimonadota bacterium]|nr:hypothetical protein [Gemmatimonadota bacterium]